MSAGCDATSDTLDLSFLARPNVQQLVAYRCARDDYDEGVLLDANENTRGPPLKGIADLSDAGMAISSPEGISREAVRMELERYPDPRAIEVKKLWAGMRGHGLTPANFFVGVGSDEAIDLLIRVFCTPGKDEILQCPPTYGMYKVSAASNDVAVRNVPLTPGDFQIRPDDILAAVTPRTKLVFLCSPGNPTGRALDLADVAKVAHGFKGITVVDEAYVDFALLQGKLSGVSLMASCPRVVVMQTLSKAWGLAGIRCGAAIAHPSVAALLNKLKAPYNVNKLTARVATDALSRLPEMRASTKQLLECRTQLVKGLQGLDCVETVFPSDCNFLLVRMSKGVVARAMYLWMAARGVVVRDRSHELHCGNCLRITVGRAEENVAVLAKLAEAAAVPGNKAGAGTAVIGVAKAEGSGPRAAAWGVGLVLAVGAIVLGLA